MPNSSKINSTDLLHLLREKKVIPDVISDAPGVHPLALSYDGSEIMHAGQEMSRSSTLNMPEIRFTHAEVGERYVLVMIDPDLLKKHDTKSGQVRYWVQEVTFDLQGKAILGVQITEYLAPGAHGDTTRRYVFLLCKIPDGVALGPFEVTSGPSDDLESRKHFHVEDYIKANNLTIVGATLMFGEAEKANLGIVARAAGKKSKGK